MKLVIIGSSVAGQTVAEMVRSKDLDVDITIITEENHPYYTRIFLPSYIVKEKTLEELYMRKYVWYKEKNIKLITNSKVMKIDPSKKQVFIQNINDPVNYDKLTLATGSSARKLSYNKPNIAGMFTLRTIADADGISKYITENNVKNILVIGGGLLGIELAFHLLSLKVKVTICEIFPYLLPRQLDKGSAQILQTYLESKGINIITGEEVIAILGENKVQGVSLKSGKSFEADMIFQQMGVIPNLSLAKDAGLKTDKGILVNEFMQTSDPNIYAAGDCIQFRTQLWGIIPACLDQAKIAATHLLGTNPKPYEGTFWNTKLKIAGLKLACYGTPPTDGSKSETVLANADTNCFMCRKITLENEKIKGAIIIGSGDDLYFMKNIGKPANIEEIKKKLAEDSTK